MGKYTVSGSVIVKAGADVDPSLNTEYEEIFIPQAEAFINCSARKDFSGSYSSLNYSGEKILDMVCSDLAAVYAINYERAIYESRPMAGDMVNFLLERVDAGIRLLNDDKVRAFIGA